MRLSKSEKSFCSNSAHSVICDAMVLNISKYLSSFGSKRNIDSLLLVFILKLLARTAEERRKYTLWLGRWKNSSSRIQAVNVRFKTYITWAEFSFFFS